MDLQLLALFLDPRLIEIALCVAVIGALRWLNHAG
jgi:hypothetical protein